MVLQLRWPSLTSRWPIYRNVPVHPDDRPLLGMCWENVIYLDTALPFGLRSAPKLFTAVADGLLFAMRVNGIQWVIHYLDDFLFARRANLDSCALNTCQILGVPVASEKIKGPHHVFPTWEFPSTLKERNFISQRPNSPSCYKSWGNGRAKRPAPSESSCPSLAASTMQC